ncbi:MarR family winged helix-turn-helix transcriptional regulator [Occallatibacter savannae]|uniref:MarR family winged helix-turn-helix transcriptional regulator n=1 Tax=Occallatibacter savannae TaxID=1002691 RepID=UPI0013A598E2|nr:MarR family transcriptional regulator [Occallatibacter savannae]
MASRGQSGKCQAQAEQFLNAWFEVRQLIQALNLSRFKQEGLSATQFMVINVLNPAGPTTAVELAERLNVHPATIVRTLDGLEERKLIGRTRNVEDRREVHVTLTAKGRELQNSARGGVGRQIATIFCSMSETGRDALLAGYCEFAEAGRRALGNQKQR